MCKCVAFRVLMEGTNFRAAEVHPDGVLVHLTQQAPGSAAQEAGGAGGAGNLQLRWAGEASTSGRTEREVGCTVLQIEIRKILSLELGA